MSKEYRTVKVDVARVLAIYVRLLNKQYVNYAIAYEMFECSLRTFYKIIATIRDAIENPSNSTYMALVYNKKKFI